MITFYEFGDVKDLADVKYHIELKTQLLFYPVLISYRVTIIGTRNYPVSGRTMHTPVVKTECDF